MSCYFVWIADVKGVFGIWQRENCGNSASFCTDTRRNCSNLENVLLTLADSHNLLFNKVCDVGFVVIC